MSLVPQGSGALTVSTGEPTPTTRKRETVLDEDTYVEAMNTIIERDFFPSLPRLRAQVEWLEAKEAGDIQKLRQLQEQYATPKGTQRLKTPSALFSPGATPSKRSRKDDGSDTPSSTASGEGEPGVTKVNTNLPLDKFLAKFTSEDNSSFEDIMEQNHKRHKERYSWLYDPDDKNKPLLLEGNKNPTLQITDGSSTQSPTAASTALVVAGDNTANTTMTKLEADGRPSAQLEYWKYKAKNSLMYHPEGVGPSLEDYQRQEAKEIKHDNTRLPGKIWSENLLKKDEIKPEVLWSMLSNSDRELLIQRKLKEGNAKLDLDDLVAAKEKIMESPKVGGYGFLRTPSPAPGKDASPFITWGEIVSTPLLLPEDTPLLTGGGGPQFKMPEPPRRENVAHSLAEKVTHKAKPNKPAIRPGSANRKPTGSSSGWGDALRASYSPRQATPSPKSTPSWRSPSPKLHKQPPSPAAKPPPAASPSITDNLLNI